MIAQISGTLIEKLPGEVVVDAGGVGYQIFISLNAYYELPEVGAQVRLFTHLHVREDAFQLFGFVNSMDRQVFLLLTGVNGIGPKLAVNILSGIPADDLARAVREENQRRLVAIPGVGRKLAERMVVELRDRLGDLSKRGSSGDRGPLDSQLATDAVSALVNLGYRRSEIEQPVRDIVQAGAARLEDVIKEVLRKMSR